MPKQKVVRFPNKSEAAKRRNRNPEYIKKQRESHLGKTLNISDEVRKAASERVKKNPPHKGHKHTEESIQKMRENRKGKGMGENNCNFGKPVSDERKEKQRQSMVGKMAGVDNPMYDVHFNGADNHFYGKHHDEESKQKVSASKQGIAIEDWVGYLLPINQHIRKSHRYKETRMAAMKDAVFKDCFTGVKGTHEHPIQCHHKIPHNTIMKLYNITTKDEADKCDLLFDKHNLIVMLASAHDRFHNLYGDNHNIYELTPEQIQELYA